MTVQLLESWVEPHLPPGVAAPIGALLVIQGAGSVFCKTGELDTDWVPVSKSSADPFAVPWQLAQHYFPDAFVAFDHQCTDLAERGVTKLTWRLYRRTNKRHVGTVQRDRLSLVAYGFTKPDGSVADLKLVWHPDAAVWSRGSTGIATTPRDARPSEPLISTRGVQYAGPFGVLGPLIENVDNLKATGAEFKLLLTGDVALTGVSVGMSQNDRPAPPANVQVFGRRLTIANTSYSHTLILRSESARSDADARFLLSHESGYRDVRLAPGRSVSIVYSGPHARWRLER